MEAQDFPLFQDLDPKGVEDFIAACDPITVPVGEVFIRQGEDDHCIFFVLDGEMKVVHQNGPQDDEHELARIKGPAVVGEMEFLTREPRAASVLPLTTLRALTMPYDRLVERLDRGDAVTLRVLFRTARTVARRLAAMNQKFAELERQPSGTRFHQLRDFQQKLMNEWTFQ